jgi:hypothetical protein
LTGNEVQDFAVSGAHGEELLIGQRFAVLADDGDVVGVGMRVDADEEIQRSFAKMETAPQVQHPQARQFSSESHRFKTNSGMTVFKTRNAVRVQPWAQHSPSSEWVFALTCAQGPARVLLTLLCGCGPAATVSYEDVWVAGPWFWLLGPPPARGAVMRFLVGQEIPWKATPGRKGELALPVCPAKGGVDSVHTYVCFMAVP